jgi:membrane associated rhomboid family serine protease
MSSLNRSYSFSFGSTWTPAVKILIITNVGIFAVQELARLPLSHLFGLVPYAVIFKGWAWQLITYMFLHGGLMHVAFNMLALWMFGSQLERVWGTKEFLRYYLITGVGAGAINIAASPTSPIPTIGASGAIFGLLLAYGVLFPNNLILLYFFIPIKAKYFVVLFAALEFLMARSYTADGVAHFAHLGGMAVGFLYLKSSPLVRRTAWRISKKSRLRIEAQQVKREARRMTDLQAIRSEVDYLLDRINKVGYENLTSDEKERLEEASRILRLYSEHEQDLN